MAVKQIVTPEDLFLMPEGDERYELIEGELVRMSLVGQEHSEIGANFVALLYNHVIPRRHGKIYGLDTGFVSERFSNTVLCPDVAFVRADLLPPQRQDRYLRVVPDLVVEIVSPSDSSTVASTRRSRST